MDKPKKYNSSRSKARYRDCHSTAFADRHCGQDSYPSNKTGATLLTNRYFVEKDPYQVSEHQENATVRDLRAISKNNGKDYIDPCKILA